MLQLCGCIWVGKNSGPGTMGPGYPTLLRILCDLQYSIFVLGAAANDHPLRSVATFKLTMYLPSWIMPKM